MWNETRAMQPEDGSLVVMLQTCPMISMTSSGVNDYSPADGLEVYHRKPAAETPKRGHGGNLFAEF
jgi:hypothetical protein